MANGPRPIVGLFGNSDLGPQKCGGEDWSESSWENHARRVHAPGVLPPTLQVQRHTHHTRSFPWVSSQEPPSAGKGMRLWVLGVPRTVLPERRESSTRPCRGSAGLLLTLSPALARQPETTAGATLPSAFTFVRRREAEPSLTCTNHVCRLLLDVSLSVLCPFRTETFKIWGPQGC